VNSKLTILGTAALIAAMLGCVAYAQESAGHLPLTDADLYPPEAPQDLSMQSYLSQRPELIDAIRKEPTVLRDPEFLKLQPRIVLFLRDHPEVAQAVKKNPAVFLQYAFDTQPKLERGQNPDLQDYLAHHPEVAQPLRENPRLIDDENFVEVHPTLKSYLMDHPAAREEVKANPNRFIHQDLGNH
jgi:hypothetical protein